MQSIYHCHPIHKISVHAWVQVKSSLSAAVQTTKEKMIMMGYNCDSQLFLFTPNHGPQSLNCLALDRTGGSDIMTIIFQSSWSSIYTKTAHYFQMLSTLGGLTWTMTNTISWLKSVLEIWGCCGAGLTYYTHFTSCQKVQFVCCVVCCKKCEKGFTYCIYLWTKQPSLRQQERGANMKKFYIKQRSDQTDILFFSWEEAASRKPQREETYRRLEIAVTWERRQQAQLTPCQMWQGYQGSREGVKLGQTHV